MVTKSQKRRPNKRSISSKHDDICMSTLQAPRFIFNFIKRPVFVAVVMAFGLVALLGISSIMWSSVDKSTKFYTIQVVNQFPHDPKAFTQGLLYGGNGTLFESTGLNGRSSVRKVDLRTGKVEIRQDMNSSYFGEGLTLYAGRLFQVTWRTSTGFTYDRNNFSKVHEFTHEMLDGWGLATDGKILFGSDGTSTLYQLDPQTLKVIAKNVVKYNNDEVRYLNELEFIKGEVWANVWQTDCIARISHEHGAVLGWVLLPNLRESLRNAGHFDIDVLNGIAWDSQGDRIFVTGKLWPVLYEIKLIPIKKQISAETVKLLCMP